MVRRAAVSVTTYYGRFPVQRARVSITQSEDTDESIHGTTWGDIEDFQGVSRMSLGGSVSKTDLAADWTMTREFVHMGMASLDDEHHWLEEGLATYVEPIARAKDGQLAAEKVWKEMVSGMPQGEPQRGDRGLDRTHTWWRTYWGGAMPCLVADVEIRRATGNRKGLQDALRAIVAAGAAIDTDSALPPILHIGDQATGTTVLSNLYQRWKDRPMIVNLEQLWGDLAFDPGRTELTSMMVRPLRRSGEPSRQGHRSRNHPDELPIEEIVSPAPGSLIGAGDRFVWVREQRCR